ncbi:MAG: transcriptional regulator [Streptosporangiales bacterium]|nr:transcriptional regulator [Streptosporangiales bacterium]
MVAFDLLGRRWALRIVWELREEHLGFRALQQRCGGMSSSVLRDRLAELAGAAIVEIDDAGRYALSEHGRGLLAALRPLSRWADEWGRSVYRSSPSEASEGSAGDAGRRDV